MYKQRIILFMFDCYTFFLKVLTMHGNMIFFYWLGHFSQLIRLCVSLVWCNDSNTSTSNLQIEALHFTPSLPGIIGLIYLKQFCVDFGWSISNFNFISIMHLSGTWSIIPHHVFLRIFKKFMFYFLAPVGPYS